MNKEFKIFLKNLIRSVFITFVFFYVLVSSSSYGQRHSYTEELETKVNSLMLPLVRDSMLYGTILISYNGAIVFCKGYGMANIERRMANRPETIFKIGSITKTFTATAIMQLHEKRDLNIKDPVKKYLPHFPNGHKITIYHLLTHTSGLPNYNRDHFINLNSPFDSIFAWIKQNPSLRFDPGEKYEYCNSGYTVLTKIIETVTQESYEEYVLKNIFVPCNMRASGAYLPEGDGENLAIGYSRKDYGGLEKSYMLGGLGKGDGCILSTAYDIHKFLACWNNNTLLKEESKITMLKPFKDNYGLGWYIDEQYGEKVFYHPGGEPGYMSMMKVFPEKNIVLIELFNTDFLAYYAVDDELTAIALNKKWKPLFQYSHNEYEKLLKIFKEYTGKYVIDDADHFTVSVEGNNIYFHRYGYPKCEALIYSNNTLYIKDINARIRFNKTEEGKIKYLALFGLYLVEGEKEN